MTKIVFYIFLFTLLSSQPAYGFSFDIKEQRGHYTLNLKKIDFKKIDLNKKVKSGLKTEILIMAFVKNKKKEALLSKALIKTRFDLWDETYVFQQDSEKVISFKDKRSFLKKIQVIDMIVLKSSYKKVLAGESLYLKILVNPIRKEKSKKIKKWLAEKNVSRPSSGSIQVGFTSVFNGVVNRFVYSDLNQDIYGAADVIVLESSERH